MSLGISAGAESLLDPKQIRLNGLLRQSSFNSALGLVNLRWTRESERLFGKTPERAVIDAANSIAKATRQSSLPKDLKFANLNWNIVFLSKDLPSNQIPSYLEQSCHPGWMTPPSNIYISSEKVAGICFGNQPSHQVVADEQLTKVIIHEFAHALEFKMASNLPAERLRSEGFASWFEVFAAKFSNNIQANNLLSEQKRAALSKLASNQNQFLGTYEDYALAACYFHMFLDSKPISDLSKLYQLISINRVNLKKGIQSLNSWTDKDFDQHLLKFLRS